MAQPPTPPCTTLNGALDVTQVSPEDSWWKLHGATVGMWLASAPVADPFNEGAKISVHGTLATLSAAEANATAALLRAVVNTLPVVADASLSRTDLRDAVDEEYGEVVAFEALVG